MDGVWPDHPRSCGANAVGRAALVFRRGSSPLVRGQLRRSNRRRWRSRIIPARAGPTWIRPTWSRTWTDHPRSCGANRAPTTSSSTGCGSSPLVRGQLVVLVGLPGVGRIIPARAGPTGPNRRPEHRNQDHPRSCGANRASSSPRVQIRGSSPLVRGQRRYSELPHIRWRIIPARAGPTPLPSSACLCGADHPRSCGANNACMNGPAFSSGSSPLVRGQLRHASPLHVRARIIPARAGPTGWGEKKLGAGSDHPRSCGANSISIEHQGGLDGSSPLVRGQRGELQNPVRLLRIIPARAGPTSGR